MKAVISSTYDDRYLWFIPLVTWCWNKLGVDVISLMPKCKDKEREFEEMGKMTWQKVRLISKVCADNGMKKSGYLFDCPEHKEATYAQCSRLYAACLDLPEDEVLVTSDVDMALFQRPPYVQGITIFGSDLVPENQYPMCYASATVKEWRSIMKLDGKTYQESLDELLGHIETEHFRGNYWSKDQQTLWENANGFAMLIHRARPQTQFASHRVDRDDSFWEDRLNLDIIDAHLWRPGYTDENFSKILKLLEYFYPTDDFSWLVSYKNEYIKLI